MNSKTTKHTPTGDPQSRVRALLTVARDAELARIWARSGNKPLSIGDVARVALAEAGLTDEEVESVLRGKPGRKPSQAVAAKAKPAKRKAAKRMHSIWTKDELARVEVLWAEGLTVGQIAKTLGRTPAAVNIKISNARKAGKAPARRPERAKQAAKARAARLASKK